MQDFIDVLKEMEPSAMREVFVEVPDISWDDIGGLGGYKRRITRGCRMATQIQREYSSMLMRHHQKAYCFTVHQEQVKH